MRMIAKAGLLLLGLAGTAVASGGGTDWGSVVSTTARDIISPSLPLIAAALPGSGSHDAELVHTAQQTTPTTAPIRVAEAPRGSSQLGGETRRSLTRSIQAELKRVGCYAGDVDGAWSQTTRDALAVFVDRVNAALPIDQPDYILLTLLQGTPDKTCATCPSGQVASTGGRCTPRAVVAGRPAGSGTASPGTASPGTASLGTASLGTASLGTAGSGTVARATPPAAVARGAGSEASLAPTARGALAPVGTAAAPRDAQVEARDTTDATTAAAQREAQRLAERRARLEAERQARMTAAESARAAADDLARRRAQALAEARAKTEAEQKRIRAQDEARRQQQALAEARAKAEAEQKRLAAEEADRQRQRQAAAAAQRVPPETIRPLPAAPQATMATIPAPQQPVSAAGVGQPAQRGEQRLATATPATGATASDGARFIAPFEPPPYRIGRLPPRPDAPSDKQAAVRPPPPIYAGRTIVVRPGPVAPAKTRPTWATGMFSRIARDSP